jgi:hypothetical protein
MYSKPMTQIPVVDKPVEEVQLSAAQQKAQFDF